MSENLSNKALVYFCLESGKVGRDEARAANNLGDNFRAFC